MRELKVLKQLCGLLLGIFLLIGCGGSNSNKNNVSGVGEKSGDANKISLEAPIEAVNLVDNTISLAGITIKLSDATIHLNETDDVESANTNTLGSYQVGDVIKIEGVKGSDSTFTAERLVTEIEDEEDGEEVEVELSGPIESINGQSFVVLGHTITIEEDARFVKFADAAAFFASIQVGLIVQVEGDLIDGAILADEIELGQDEDDEAEEDDEEDAEDIDEEDDAEDTENEIEIIVGGPIESINGESFTVLGVTIELASDVEFEGIANKALFLSSISVGTFVKVEGDYINGILIGDEVQFGQDDEIEIGLGGAVESINGESFVVHGIQVILEDDTLFVGFANANEFLNSLVVGQYIEVDGDLKDGILEAEEIEVNDDEEEEEEEGEEEN